VDEEAKLKKLAKKSNHIIYEVSSVFPFQLFPDKLVIDENKITIVRKEIFFKRIYSVMFADILTVRVNRGILFAAIEFDVKRMDYHLRPLTYLKPKEASLAKKYIMGLCEAKRENIDLSKLTVEQIRGRLEEIGESQPQDEAESLF
jgi:hypothetical protein